MIPDLIKNTIFSPFTLVIKLALWAIGLSIVVGVVCYLFVDLNSFKGQIETVATEFMQDKLKINGDIKLGVKSFRPSLVFYDVKVGTEGKTTVLLTDRLEITIPLTKVVAGAPWTFFANLKNIQLDGKKLGDYDMPIRFFQDGFEIPEINGKLNGSRLTGHLNYLQDKLDLKLNLRDMDYAEIAEGIKGGDVMIDVALTAHGKTYEQLVRTLNGTAFLMGGEGQMAGKAIDFWAAGLLESILSGTEKETKLECTVADFKIVNGVAQSNSIIFDTNRVTVTGKGSIDLVKERVDLNFKPIPKMPSLVNLATPVMVSGSFNNIQTHPEPLGMLKKLGGLVLTTVNPAMMILPMLEESSFGKNPCVKYLKK